MASVYDNWERLVTSTLRREQLRQIALRTPSDLSSVSAESPSQSVSFSLNYGQVSSFLVGDSFTYLQILKATDCLNDSNLIKRGHSGDLYFGVLESGIEVVVKKVNVSSADKAFCFVSEMKVCGMVCHSRVIPLLGYCGEDADEKFLVYKYMPNKDLSRFLNGRNDDEQQATSLDWTTRLKIAIGSAEGLCYLHHECSPPLVHR